MTATANDAANDGLGLLTSPVRRLIVDTLANRGAMTAAELGQAIDLHATTVRFHLDQLLAADLLTTRFLKTRAVGRPRKLYDVAPGTLPDPEAGPESLKLLTSLLADSFGRFADGSPITPAEAGERWARDHVTAEPVAPATTPGQWLAKVGRMIDVLTQWGYTPNLRTSNGGRTAEIDLVRCPFLELARTNTAVVCGIHRGLIAGSMRQFGEEHAEVSLEPFVEPHRCVAHVTTQIPFSPAHPTSKDPS